MGERELAVGDADDTDPAALALSSVGLVRRAWLRASGGLEQRAYSWILALLLAAFAVYPALMHPIEERALDAAAFHVHRGVVFSEASAEGWLFPRWVQGINAGLGGPLFSFYPPMLYQMMDLLARFGITHPLAFRLIIALALLAGAVGMFGFALRLFKRADVAWVCAAAFTYAPHLLRDLFERGSPQGLAVILYPWVLWALLRLVERPSGGRLLLASLCWATALLLHTAAALWLLPVIGLFLICLAWRTGRLSLPICLAALLAGALLAAFFLVPFVGERQYVQHERGPQATRPDLNPVGVADLLALPAILDTGLGNNGMGVSVGLLHAPLFIAGLVIGVILWRRGRTRDLILPAGAAGLGLATIWLQTAAATFVWAGLPVLNTLQFRWRLQSTTGLLAALVLGSWLTLMPGRWRSALLASLVAAYVGLSLPSLYPQLLTEKIAFPAALTASGVQAAAFQLGVPTLSAFGEDLPIWRQQPFTEEEARMAAAVPIANLPEGARVIRDERRTGHWRIQVETPSAFQAALHVLYYPGWVGYVNGRRQPLSPMEGTGYAQLAIPPGSHEIILRYEGTALQRLGDWLSVGALVGLLLLAVMWRGNKRLWAAGDVTYPRACWWLPVGLLVLVGLKAFYVDSYTTWLRRASTCEAVSQARIHTDVWFGDQVRLCGYTITRSVLAPPGTLRVTFYWQVREPVTVPAYTFVHLVGTTFEPNVGYTMWDQENKLLPGYFPLTRWVPGKLYEDTYELRVSPHASPAEYQFEVGWWTPTTGQRLQPRIARPGAGLAISRADSLLIFEPVFQPPRVENPLQATLGQVVRLHGYRLRPNDPRPGQTLYVTLYWQAVAPMETSYTVFVHLLDSSGQVRAQHDGVPVYGGRPTNRWLPNQVQVDVHEIVVPADLAPGRYVIQVGMYDAATGARLPGVDARGVRLDHDRILFDEFTVGPP